MTDPQQVLFDSVALCHSPDSQFTTHCDSCAVQTTVGTNYFGHYYLTHLLLGNLIKTQKEGGMARAVFMSSTFEQLGNINWDDLE